MRSRRSPPYRGILPRCGVNATAAVIHASAEDLVMFGNLSGLTFARAIGPGGSQMKNVVSSLVLSATLLGLGGGCVVETRTRARVVAPPPPAAVVEVEVEEAPPPPRAVVVQTRPGFVWVEGRWYRRHGRWEWRDGYWERERRGYVWVPGRWDRRGRHHVWVEGSWRVR